MNKDRDGHEETLRSFESGDMGPDIQPNADGIEPPVSGHSVNASVHKTSDQLTDTVSDGGLRPEDDADESEYEGRF